MNKNFCRLAQVILQKCQMAFRSSDSLSLTVHLFLRRSKTPYGEGTDYIRKFCTGVCSEQSLTLTRKQRKIDTLFKAQTRKMTSYLKVEKKTKNSVNSSTLFLFCNIGFSRIVQFQQIISLPFSWVFTHCNLSRCNLGTLSRKQREHNANKGTIYTPFKSLKPLKTIPCPTAHTYVAHMGVPAPLQE